MEVDNPSFQNIRPQLMDVLRKRQFDNIDEMRRLLSNAEAKELDFNINIDQLFREFLLELIVDCDNDILEKYIRCAFEMCRLELCSPPLPAILLGDIFDVSSLDRCEQLFSLVGNNISVWKENLFFTACKNNILRMCNDLLRRLSRSQNTIFSGRILLFLAKFFPFSERSGLNIVSEFNVDNVTEFNNDMEIDNLNQKKNLTPEDENKIKLDYTIYAKFWSLQEYFRYPNNCYHKPKWNLFCAYTTTILTTFHLYKLDDISSNCKELDVTAFFDTTQRYFPKYLTNQRLIELQLADCNFRRYVLVQFLILFQYLNAPVRFKSENLEFKPDQTDWLKVTESKIHRLIEETPPNGKEFGEAVGQILKREGHWNQWKNEGCPELKKPSIIYAEGEPEFETPPDLPKKEILLGDFLKEVTSHDKYFLGHRQLTKLWNVNPNNLEACTGKDRNFLPLLENYFEVVLQESNPENMIEQNYKKVNDKDFSWRGLRLLARKSPYFFAQNNTPIPSTSDYIETMVSKFLKEKPSHPITVTASSNEPKIDIKYQESQDFMNEDDSEMIAQTGPDDRTYMKPEAKSNMVTKEQLDQVAELIVNDWKNVATKIGYKSDEIEFFTTERQTDEERARYLIQVWSEDSEDPSCENLAYILEGVKLFEAANILKVRDEMVLSSDKNN